MQVKIVVTKYLNSYFHQNLLLNISVLLFSGLTLEGCSWTSDNLNARSSWLTFHVNPSYHLHITADTLKQAARLCEWGPSTFLNMQYMVCEWGPSTFLMFLQTPHTAIGHLFTLTRKCVFDEKQLLWQYTWSGSLLFIPITIYIICIYSHTSHHDQYNHGSSTWLKRK